MALFGKSRWRLAEHGLFTLLAVAVGVLGACSGSTDVVTGNPGAGGSGGASGAAGTGGLGGSGGSGGSEDASVGGSGGVAGAAGQDAGADVSEDAQPDADDCVHTGPPVIDPAIFPACDLCDGAHCVPAALLPAEQVDLFADCDANNKCVPDLFIETGGDFLLASCRSASDAEGRCLSTCLPSVQAQLALLPQDTCAASERCVPCYDPTSGDETGACSLACDPGPQEPPVTLPTCCGGIGSCVPASLVPAEQQSLLGQDTCADPNTLCAPNELLDPSAHPDACRSVNDAEGRCLPACLPAVDAMKDLLPQDTCADTHLCVPCYDPTTSDSTGACELNGDTPTEPPVTFDVCCGGVGLCVPASLVPASQQSLLGQDTCADSNSLCAPTDLLDPTAIPADCDSIAGAEGRCLPACLPDVQAMSGMLPQDTCAATHLCVPCYDPLTSNSTGACELNGDTPTDPPVTFDACCGGVGLCVPASLVPTEQQSLLGQDTCTDSSSLCAPADLLDPTATPDACRSVGDTEGRCLAKCLPAIQAQASLLPQDTCAATHLCAPCYDPFTAVSTGSCELNGDVPAEPPSTFPTCCPTNNVDRGTCVPEAVIDPGQAASLVQQECAANWLCAPTEKALDPTWTFPSCSAGLLGSGACLPDCYVNSPWAFLFAQGTCGSGERCVACNVFGTSTGACD